jgi:hypothetical protein
MSEFSLTLVLQFQTSKIIHDMAKISIKSEKLTPFGGIFHVRELFSRYVGSVIDKELGLRCPSFGYQYSEIVGSLLSVYFCGGDCVEDVTSHLMSHLSLHPTSVQHGIESNKIVTTSGRENNVMSIFLPTFAK